jgi:hypothetical protein
VSWLPAKHPLRKEFAEEFHRHSDIAAVAALTPTLMTSEVAMAAAARAQRGESKGERLPWKTVSPFYSMQGDHHDCFVFRGV